MSDDTILQDAREAFRLAADAEAENRREALDDLRFARLGEQWTPDIIQQRAREGRAVLTINRLPAFIRQVVNDARLNKGPYQLHPPTASPDPHEANGRGIRHRVAGMMFRLPSRMTMGLVAVGVILAVTLGLYWKGRLDGVARERPRAAAARAKAAVAALESRGERDSAVRAATAADVAAVAAGSLIDIARKAQTSEDAHAPLDPDRSRRLHAHDIRLCEWAPELAGCAAPGNAAAGAAPVRSAPSAGRADAGRP